MNALASLPLNDEFCDQLHIKFFQLKLSFLYFVFLNVSCTKASLSQGNKVKHILIMRFLIYFNIIVPHHL